MCDNIKDISKTVKERRRIEQFPKKFWRNSRNGFEKLK